MIVTEADPRRPRVGVDWDDTLFPYDQPLLAWHDDQFATSYYGVPRTEYFYNMQFGGTIPDWEEKTRLYADYQRDHGCPPPIEGAPEGLYRVAEIADIIVFTARGEEDLPLLEQAADEHFGDSISRIVPLGSHDKVEQLVEDEVDAHIDDRGKTCADAAEAGIFAVRFGGSGFQGDRAFWPGATLAETWEETSDLVIAYISDPDFGALTQRS